MLTCWRCATWPAASNCWPGRWLTAAPPRCWKLLAWLFHSHGGPVVLKTDNGSAFRAAMAQAYLRQWGVTSLFSPPRTPRYNGSIEAGIGSLTMRAERLATHRGHPGVWTWDTLEAAREANATARPRGLGGLSPEEVWAARGPIESGGAAALPGHGGVLPRRVVSGDDRRRTRRQVRNRLGIVVDPEGIRRRGSSSGQPCARSVRLSFGLEEANSPTYSWPKSGENFVGDTPESCSVVLSDEFVNTCTSDPEAV